MSREKNAQQRQEGISEELDQLSSQLMGDALDLLAEGLAVNVLLVVEDEQGTVAPFEFLDDGQEALLEGAYNKVRQLVAQHGDPDLGLTNPVRYALTYEGAIGSESGNFQDALILEFGEAGHKAYSGFSVFTGRGTGEDFEWSEPAAAGEVEPLI